MTIHRKDPGNLGRGVFVFACLVVGAMACGCSLFKPHRNGWRDAVIDPESKNIVVMWLTLYDKEEPQCFETRDYPCDYAMFIVWNGNEKRFYLFDNSAKKYFGTSDFDKFLAALDAMPQGIKMVWINTCQAGECYDMPQDARDRLAEVMKKGQREHVDDYPYILCTCETTDRRFLDFTTDAKEEK
jgi:hypothetical protein